MGDSGERGYSTDGGAGNVSTCGDGGRDREKLEEEKKRNN